MDNTIKKYLLVCVIYLCLAVSAFSANVTIKTFPDIQGHWAQKHIEAMTTLGLLKGMHGTDFFWPDQYITREEVAVMFLTASEVIPPIVEKCTFRDIFPKYWAAPYIEEAARLGYVGGYQYDRFAPRGIVNRTEGVLMAINFAGINSDITARSIAPDLPEGYWANRYLTAAFTQRFLPLTWDMQKGFFPLKSMTRAEMAYLLARSQTVRDKIEVVFGKKWFSSNEPYLNNTKEHVKRYRVLASKKEDAILANNQESVFECSPAQAEPGNTVTINMYTNRLLTVQEINTITIDLSPVGRMENTILLDDGMWEDKQQSDGVYTIKVKISKGTSKGITVLPVYITDKNNNMVEGEVVLTIL
ncbi:MAG: S-layer homology domain-containing protein [Candidatus Margulisiibacteriota bacterium]